MSNYKKVQSYVDNELGLSLATSILEECKKHIGTLFYNDGINVHLNSDITDNTNNYSHISDPDLCHIPIVESDDISIYKYQLIFKDMVFKTKVPLILYKVYINLFLDEQKQVVSQLQKNLDIPSTNALFTINSKFGMHLPYHTDKFKWRYHQNLRFLGQEALEFVDGEKVILDKNESYIITNPNMPHRVIIEQSESERIFLSAGL